MHLAQRQNDGRRCYPKICAGSVLAASLLMLVVCVVFWQGAVAHTDLPPCWSGARVERCEIASAVVKHVRMSQDECATFASAYKWYKCVGVWVTYAFVDPAGNRSLMIYSETRNDLRLFPQWFVMQNTSAWTTQQWQDARVLVLDKFVNVSSTWRVAATLVRDGRDGDDALQGWSALSLVSATGIVSRLYDSPLKTVEQASDRHVAFSPHRARPRNFNQNGREWWVNVWPRKSITAWWVPYIITSSVLAVWALLRYAFAMLWRRDVEMQMQHRTVATRLLQLQQMSSLYPCCGSPTPRAKKDLEAFPLPPRNLLAPVDR